MNFSRSVRAQLSTLALVLSVVGQVRQSVAEFPCPRLRRKLARLQLDHGYCWTKVTAAAGVPWKQDEDGTRILLLPKDRYGQWLRENEILNQAVLRTIPAGPISARAWINAVLDATIRQIDAMPRNPLDRRATWNAVLDALQAVYEEYDPELSAYDEIEVGLAYAKKINHHQIIGTGPSARPAPREPRCQAA